MAQRLGRRPAARGVAVWALLTALVLAGCLMEGVPSPPAMYSTDDRPLRVILEGRTQPGTSTDVDGLTLIFPRLEPTGPLLDPHCTTEGSLLLETAESPHKVVYERDLESEPVCGDTIYLWDGETFRERSEGRFPVPDAVYSEDAD